MKRNFVCLIAAAVLLVCLFSGCGCSNDVDQTDPTPSAVPSATPEAGNGAVTDTDGNLANDDPNAEGGTLTDGVENAGDAIENGVDNVEGAIENGADKVEEDMGGADNAAARARRR